MSSISSDPPNSISLNPRAAALLYSLILAQQASAGSDEEQNVDTSPRPMPTPVSMPLASHAGGPEGVSPGFQGIGDIRVGTRPSVLHNRLTAQGGPPPMPEPQIPKPNLQSSGGAGPSTTPNAAPSRPSTPTDLDVATTSLSWQLHTLPLFKRIADTLYGSEKNLPPPTTGCIGYLKLDGCSSRDTTDNMCALIQFLQGRKWEDQSVEAFVASMRDKPHWPRKFTDAPHKDHVKHAWSLVEGLLAIFAFKDYLPPSPPPTFHGIVTRIFPDLPDKTSSRFLRMPKDITKPQNFSFSVRDLLEEGFMIEPINNMVDHLKLEGSVVKVLILDAPSVKVLMSYHQNRAAQAIGMANLGNEVLQSYQALTASEFQENFKLPISLGMFKIDPDSAKHGFDDLTVVTGIIRLFHNNPEFDPVPHLLASRVYAIETALRTRRHWYKRLRRDIHKRKKEEPWMFWGAVLAVFFGVCTVIQTVTSVWSLVISASSS